MRCAAAVLLIAGLSASVCGQEQQDGPRTIDECGVLVRGTECVLFEGAGGRYVLPSAGNFRVGDAVRVVGTVDPTCITICMEGDGCIRGAVLYDPAVLPCGTKIPDFPGDLISGVCSSVSAALLTITVAGLWYTRRRTAFRR